MRRVTTTQAAPKPEPKTTAPTMVLGRPVLAVPRPAAPPPRPAPPPQNVASSFFESEPQRSFSSSRYDSVDRVQLEQDLSLVDRLINADEGDMWGMGEYVDSESNLYDNERDAFEDMRQKLNDGRPLSEKQRAWVRRAAERLSVPIAEYTGEVLKAEVPRGKDVEPAPVLRTLPLAPPGKKAPEPTGTSDKAEEMKVRFGTANQLRAAFNASTLEKFAEAMREIPTASVNALLKPSVDLSEVSARAIYAATPNILEPLALLLGIDEFALRKAYVQAARLDATRAKVTSPDGIERRVLHTLDGKINNCAVAAGEGPRSCQVCNGDCPDLFGREEDDVPI